LLIITCIALCEEAPPPGPAPSPYPSFPHYLQCDKQWGADQMGVPGKDAQDDTICHQGCAMSCVAMALAGFKLSINGSLVTPGSLNTWLRGNNGYTCIAGDCCNLILSAPNGLAPKRVRCLGEPQTPFLPTLVKMIRSGIIVLLHVTNPQPHHFVLVTGFQAPNLFIVNDPFYPRTSYSYEEVHDVLLYDMI